VADLDLGLLSARVPPPPDSVEAPARLPGSEVDLTVTHPTGLRWRELESCVRAGAPAELLSVEAKGRYRGPRVPEGFVKTTMTLRFGAPERSLSREEINAWRDAAAARLLAVPETKVDGIPAPGA
jgi:phenylalanyl-tRNA synthetase beta subunit